MTDAPEPRAIEGRATLDRLSQEQSEADSDRLRLTLPATSANLGPGFDSLGLALSLFLTIEASAAEVFSIDASGREAHLTSTLDDNLILTTYREILERHQRPVRPLSLRLHNDIPLGMGCGSSAAALCAGVLLANHFGQLEWTMELILNEAAHREGHPDNVAACLLGGLTASKTGPAVPKASEGLSTAALSFGAELEWRLLLALPHASLSTAKARQLLPDSYSRADTIHAVQSTALLVSAFALDRPDLLWTATDDRLHQPYRTAVCPLLRSLLPLSGRDGVYSVTLSGAGPSVLLIVKRSFPADLVWAAAGQEVAEVLELSIAGGARTSSKR